MFCTRCSTGNPDRAVFCLSCGAALPGEGDDTAQRTENGTDTAPLGESVNAEDGSEVTAVAPDVAHSSAATIEDQAQLSTPVSTPTADDRRADTTAETSLWRRAVGWTSVTLGLGVAIIAIIGLIAAQGGLSTAVANVTGSAIEPGSSSIEAVPLKDAVLAPNVIGLQKAAALDRLVSVGVDPAVVTITVRPSPGGSEIVMDQVPRPGEVVTGPVALVIAEPIIVMPDVIGLDADIAAAILQDAGIDQTSISLSELPFATIPNLVLEQTPRAGTSAPIAVELTVAGIAVAPDVVGMSANAGLAAFEEIGAETALVSVPMLDVVPQTIVGQSTPAGSTVTGPVELTLAIEPPSTSLSDLGGDDWDRCYVDTVEVGDTNYPNTVYCSSRDVRDAWIVYRLDRVYSRLRLELGLLDSSSASRAVVEIRGDGALAESLSVSKGVYPTIDLQVGRFSTIEIRVRGDDAKVALLGARVYEPTQPIP